jgi:hypothetical protein
VRRSPPALLVAALALVGCTEPARPPTPRAAHLGAGPTSSLPPLHRDDPRPARGFLLDAPAVERRGDVLRLEPLPDGALGGGVSIAWTAEGAEVVGGDDGRASLRPGVGPWTATASLLRRGREIARVVARSPAPGDGGGPASPSVRAVEAVPLDPRGCGGVRFPARVRDGHVGCAGGESPALDRFLPRGSPMAVALDLPQQIGRKEATLAPPEQASVSDGVLAWAADTLGVWPGPGGGEVHWLPGGDVLGAPAVGGGRVAVLRSDRVEVAALGSSQRSLLPAQPADVPGAVALGGPWLALLEGEPGAATLRLRDLARNREATVGEAADRWDLHVDDRWLTWQEGSDVCWLDLAGGALRRADLAAVRGRESDRYGDLLLLPTLDAGGVALTALHLPSGTSEVLRRGEGDLRLRGASGDGVTISQGPFGGGEELLSLALAPTAGTVR